MADVECDIRHRLVDAAAARYDVTAATVAGSCSKCRRDALRQVKMKDVVEFVAATLAANAARVVLSPSVETALASVKEALLEAVPDPGSPRSPTAKDGVAARQLRINARAQCHGRASPGRSDSRGGCSHVHAFVRRRTCSSIHIIPSRKAIAFLMTAKGAMRNA